MLALYDFADSSATGKAFEFVKANRADHMVVTMCWVLGVSASRYDAWLRRGPSPRARRNVELSAPIEAIHRDSRGTRGVDRRKWKKTTAPDLVRRDFSALAADELWVADATCVPTLAGFLFFAVVVDVYSRRGVIHHSDRGSQFTSIAFGNRCRDAGVRLSMGSTGDCYDNALCEFLRHVGVRIDRSRDVPHAARGRVGDLRFHRGVLQQQSPPLVHRLPEPGGVRAPGRSGPYAGGGVIVAAGGPAGALGRGPARSRKRAARPF